MKYLLIDGNNVEITGYGDHCKGWGAQIWLKYQKNIEKKKYHVENVLGAKFIFKQIIVNKKQTNYIRRNSL